MRKTHSKSQLTQKKNKSTATYFDSKKGSKVLKASSCVKVTSENTERGSTQPMSTQMQKTSSISLSQKLIGKMAEQGHYVDKPVCSLKESGWKKGRSGLESSRNEGQGEEVRKLRGRNEELQRENVGLKDKCSDLQEASLRDKEKIKNLIIRINEVKNGQARSGTKSMHPSTSLLPGCPQSSSKSYALLPQKRGLDTPFKAVGQCDNHQCQQRKKYLQSELYKQRVARDQLQLQRREWQRNRDNLKQQYRDLLGEIRDIRSDDC